MGRTAPGEGVAGARWRGTKPSFVLSTTYSGKRAAVLFCARQPCGSSKDESPSSLVQPGCLKSTIQNFDASDEDFRNNASAPESRQNKDIKISDRTDK